MAQRIKWVNVSIMPCHMDSRAEHGAPRTSTPPHVLLAVLTAFRWSGRHVAVLLGWLVRGKKVEREM